MGNEHRNFEISPAEKAGREEHHKKSRASIGEADVFKAIRDLPGHPVVSTAPTSLGSSVQLATTVSEWWGSIGAFA